jgi:hypothetical protein
MVLVANPALAIEVEQVVWGFDGRAAPDSFIPLSLLIGNPSSEPFEGSLQLIRQNGIGERVGAKVVEPIYISPFASRWVQFYPFVDDRGNKWTLSWNRGMRRYNIPNPTLSSEPARILLDDPRDLTQRGGSLKRLPENLFPPMVTATAALGAVVLDHAPRWEEARRQAFLDWLYRGGVVHVIYEINQKYPEFPASLSELQSPLEMQRVGAGIVYRHQRTRNELDLEFVNSLVRAVRKPTSQNSTANQNDGAVLDGNGDPLPDDQDFDPDLVYYQNGNWNGDRRFLDNLKQMTQVNHNWALIYLMAIVYILLIFPGCYILGRLRVDYRLTFGALLATVALFSLCFWTVGRRGYGEATIVHSVAIARPLADGYYDVQQWSNVFVTDGDDYSITHPGSGGLYSTCQDFEGVNGIIKNGLEGQFLVDIPPYSSRTFAHRIKLKSEPISLEVEKWEAAKTLQKLVLSAGKNFPKQTQQIYALYRDQFYSLSHTGGRLQLKTNLGSVPGFLRPDEYDDFRFRGGMFFSNSDDRTPEQRFRDMLVPLLARNLGVSKREEIDTFFLPDDRIRLFAYAPMPETFFTDNQRFGKQQGYVLYSFDVFKPETP